MKVSLVVKSEVVFTLLEQKFTYMEKIPSPEIKRHQSMKELEDSIEFYKPDLFIVHKEMEGSDSYINLLKENGLQFFIFEKNTKQLEAYVIEHFGLIEELDEDEQNIEEEINKERIIYREKVIHKESIVNRYESIPFKIVVVGSMTRSAGSTILATNLARMIGERGLSVSYVEHPLIKPYMFDYLQIHEEEEEYFDLSREIVKEDMASLKEKPFKRDGVNWHVINPLKPSLREFEYHNLLMLTHATESNIVILDISDRWRDPEVQRFMRLASLVLVAVEPDPIKFEYATLNYSEYGESLPTNEYQIMNMLKERVGNNYELVTMKTYKGLDVKMMNELYHQFKRPIATLPYIEYPTIMKALTESKLLYDYDNSLRELFETNVLSIISRFLPKDLVELSGRSKSFFGKLLKK